jgi:hypothetical protein
VAALPPPLPYDPNGGGFYLEIDGGGSVPLTAFAGCYDKILGMEYEDCYFTTGVLAAPVIEWLHETLSGNGPRRTATVFHVDQTLQILSRTDISQAFLRDFSISDFDSADMSLGSISFVLVPGSIQVSTSNPAGPGGSAGGLTFRKALFTLDIGGDVAFVAAIRGMHMSVPKLIQSGSGRRLFVPGLPQFDNILIEVGQGGSFVAGLEQWVNDVVAGDATPRPGRVDLLNQSMAVVGSVLLEGLVPLAFPPYPTGPANRRTLVLDLGQFRFP